MLQTDYLFIYIVMLQFSNKSKKTLRHTWIVFCVVSALTNIPRPETYTKQPVAQLLRQPCSQSEVKSKPKIKSKLVTKNNFTQNVYIFIQPFNFPSIFMKSYPSAIHNILWDERNILFLNLVLMSFIQPKPFDGRTNVSSAITWGLFWQCIVSFVSMTISAERVWFTVQCDT